MGIQRIELYDHFKGGLEEINKVPLQTLVYNVGVREK